jgi:hypothetical protein
MPYFVKSRGLLCLNAALLKPRKRLTPKDTSSSWLWLDLPPALSKLQA